MFMNFSFSTCGTPLCLGNVVHTYTLLFQALAKAAIDPRLVGEFIEPIFDDSMAPVTSQTLRKLHLYIFSTFGDEEGLPFPKH